jgi:hypothetical protein
MFCRFTFYFLLPSVLFAPICRAESASPAAAKPAPSVIKDSASTLWQIIAGLGKGQGQETQKPFEDGLVSRLKKHDPFQLPIRGKYRGQSEPSNPPASQQPAVAQVPATTFAQAIDHLPVRGIDVASREVLIGSRSLTEGDLLTIEFNNQPFAAWVRNVGKEGVTFVNAELTDTAQKAISSGPRDLDAIDQSGSEVPLLGRQSSKSDAIIPVSTASAERPPPHAGYGRLEMDQPDVYRLQDYPINELFEFLARKAGFQYFFNPAVNEVRVTGELARRTNPMDSMQELALQYNLAVYQRGRTIYLITPEQSF